MEVSGQLHAPAVLPPGEKVPSTNWIGGWVGSRVDLEAEEERKILTIPEIEPGPSSPYQSLVVSVNIAETCTPVEYTSSKCAFSCYLAYIFCFNVHFLKLEIYGYRSNPTRPQKPWQKLGQK
jgi:hypothetical protein